MTSNHINLPSGVQTYESFKFFGVSETEVKLGANSDILFHTGDTFSLSTYSKFFVNGAKLNNGKTLSYTVSIGSVNQDGSITITITK